MLFQRKIEPNARHLNLLSVNFWRTCIWFYNVIKLYCLYIVHFRCLMFCLTEHQVVFFDKLHCESFVSVFLVNLKVPLWKKRPALSLSFIFNSIVTYDFAFNSTFEIEKVVNTMMISLYGTCYLLTTIFRCSSHFVWYSYFVSLHPSPFHSSCGIWTASCNIPMHLLPNFQKENNTQSREIHKMGDKSMFVFIRLLGENYWFLLRKYEWKCD